MLYVHIPPPLTGTQSNLPTTHSYTQKWNVLKIKKLNKWVIFKYNKSRENSATSYSTPEGPYKTCSFGELLAQTMFLNLLHTLFFYYIGPSPAFITHIQLVWASIYFRSTHHGPGVPTRSSRKALRLSRRTKFRGDKMLTPKPQSL